MTGIRFPFQAPAADGELVDVLPGIVKWLRMPLPMALDHINLYLVRDGAGWRIVDTGMDTAAIRALWEGLLQGLDGPITGIISTHHHSDHCGLAGWLTEKLRVPLYMSRGEYMALRLFAQGASFDSWEYQEFFTRVGMAPDKLVKLVEAVKHFRGAASPVPRAYQRLRAGQRLRIGAHEWQVHCGDGHAPEHVSLYCPELGVLICGDQLLARISPNVGVMPFEPQANPLADWFESLERIGRLPEATLVLPAHELPFVGLGTRARELVEHHERLLDRLQALCATSGTVTDLSVSLFPIRRSPMDDILALSETLAHLAYLLGQGRITRTLTPGGSHEYLSAESR